MRICDVLRIGGLHDPAVPQRNFSPEVADAVYRVHQQTEAGIQDLTVADIVST